MSGEVAERKDTFSTFQFLFLLIWQLQIFKNLSADENDDGMRNDLDGTHLFNRTENGYTMEDDSGVVAGCSNLNMCTELSADETCRAGSCNVLSAEWRLFECDCFNTGYFCAAFGSVCILAAAKN